MVSPTMLFCFFTTMVVFIAMLCIATITTLRSRRPFIKSLRGKHAFITGGSSGIGLALAKKALAEGAFVTLVSRSSSKLSSAADSLLTELGCGLDHIHFEVKVLVTVKDLTLIWSLKKLGSLIKGRKKKGYSNQILPILYVKRLNS